MALLTCSFTSYALRRGTRIEMVLPSVTPCDFDPGKTPCQKPAAKYPVLYLLHGYANDSHGWLDYTNVRRYAEEQRIAVVMCDCGNSFYVDHPGAGEFYYEYLAKELPEFVCGNFAVSDRPEDTYIAGYSMGGYGAILHAFRSPEQYRAAGFLSPAVGADPARDKELTDLSELPDAYSMIRELKSSGKKIPALFLGIGQDDFLYENVTRFHRELNESGIAHRYDDIPGYGHEYPFWDQELEAFIRWLPRTDFYAGKEIHRI